MNTASDTPTPLTLDNWREVEPTDENLGLVATRGAFDVFERGYYFLAYDDLAYTARKFRTLEAAKAWIDGRIASRT